jgi:hypothetical protein
MMLAGKTAIDYSESWRFPKAEIRGRNLLHSNIHHRGHRGHRVNLKAVKKLGVEGLCRAVGFDGGEPRAEPKGDAVVKSNEIG